MPASQTRDAKLIQRYIEKVVVPLYDGSENERLVASRELLEPPVAVELFSALMKKNMPLRPDACVELLRRMVTRQGHNAAPELIAANRKIAEAAVNALLKSAFARLKPPSPPAGGDQSKSSPLR